MKKLNKKGFTITELVIVVSVIAILSAVLIPTFSGMIKKSKDSAALQDAKNAYTQYLYDNAEAEELYESFIYAYDTDRNVVIIDGDIYEDSNGKNLFTADKALEELKTAKSWTFVDDGDDPATEEVETNYDNYETVVIDKLTGYKMK